MTAERLGPHPMNDGTVRCTRVFSALGGLAFRGMLTPEHLTRLWGPPA
jgi:hypothetical protein